MSFFIRSMSMSAATVLAIMASSVQVKADDQAAKTAYEDAKNQFSARGEGMIDNAIASIETAKAAASGDASMRFDIDVLASRIYFFKGTHVDTNSEKLVQFQKGMDNAELARKENKDVGDPAYWYAISLGQWAQAKGIIESLGRKNELIANLREALTKKSKAGETEGTIDGFGPYRSLGRLYFKLPVPVGGSHSKSLDMLRKTVAGAPDYVLNWLYLTETLADGSATERAEAKALLSELVKKAPNDPSLNQNRVPEATEELERCKTLLKDLG